MLISKVFNLRHFDVFANFLLENFDGEHEEFFAIGLPPFDPPRVRGSFLILFNSDFLQSNWAAVKWWSPLDTGALRSGLYGSFAMDDVHNCRQSAEGLKRVLEKFFCLPRDAQHAWEVQRQGQLMNDALASFIPDVVRERLRHLDPGLLFNSEVIIDLSKVKWGSNDINFWIPYEFLKNERVKKLSQKSFINISYYNGRFGIEEAGRAATLFSRGLRKP